MKTVRLNSGMLYGAAAFLVAFVCCHAHAQSVKVVQSLGLTGQVAEYAQQKKTGTQLFFGAVNATGGVGGRKIELTWTEDGYNREKAVKNLGSAAADPAVIALLGPLGVPVVDALLGASDRVGMTSGADASRAKVGRYAFPVRATYGKEATATIKLLQTLGHDRVHLIAGTQISPPSSATWATPIPRRLLRARQGWISTRSPRFCSQYMLLQARRGPPCCS